MVELTRRWFVFGSVAAVAAAAIPEPVRALLEPPIERLPSAHVFLKRAIRDIAFGFNATPDDAPNQMVIVKTFVHRNGERVALPVHVVRINVRFSYRWVAPGDDAAIVVMPEDTFEIEVSPDRHVGRFSLMMDDTIDDGPPVQLSEIFDWPRSGPAQPMFLHPDNSLEARLARRDAEPVASSDDYPEDDYDV